MMKTTPLNAIVDRVWGEKGTPDRDEMEVRLKEELDTYHIAQVIKEESIK